MVKRIAILGSCVSRDNFNTKFNPNYKDHYQCVAYQHQQSIISLMSDRVEYEKSDIDLEKEFDRFTVETDLSKNFFERLLASNPDYLIIDFFADVFYGCLKFNESTYITNNSSKLWKTSYYAKIKDNTSELRWENDADHYLNEWKKRVDELFTVLNEQFKDCRVIVNKSHFTDYCIVNDTLIRLSDSGKCKRINVEQTNVIWDEMNEYVIQKHDVLSLDMIDELYVSYESHPWGPFYVHFTKNYYHDFLRKLKILTEQ